MHEPTDKKSPSVGLLNHPPGLYTLFFTEMWERFSYYGMRAILMLFMLAPVAAGGLGMPTEEAGAIYAMYTSLVYLMSIPGGWIADNLLGQRKSVFYGGIVIMLGHILLAFHGLPFFFGGLACVVLGTGLLKPNISAIVGQLYEEKDNRRDAGFSIFYMGINLGAFTAPLVCGYLAQHSSFRQMLESCRDDSVVAYMRKAKNWEDHLLVVCNFTPVVRQQHLVGAPQKRYYREVFNSDSQFYGGSNVGNFPGVMAQQPGHHGRPYSLSIKLPPLATVVFKPE